MNAMQTTTLHNPDRYMADLRQILSQGRKRIGILIGAGAPTAIRVDKEGGIVPEGEPLIPDVAGLTAFVYCLTLCGLNSTQAFAVGFMSHLILTLMTLPGGLFYLREGFGQSGAHVPDMPSEETVDAPLVEIAMTVS